MIDRPREIKTLRGLISRNPVVGIIGARQVGKTTLARSFMAQMRGLAHYFDLENPEDEARLGDPMLALKGLKGIVVIDEIQRIPGLFPVLRVLVDRPRPAARFLVLGSASPELLRQGSETLAGRIIYHELKSLALDEVGVIHQARLWLRGGFPRAYLARTTAASDEWRRGFIRTFLERDLPQLGINIRATTLRRFWTMLAHYHGQIWNSSEFARSFGVADTTVRNYLDTLTSALVVTQLQPWHENISKRQVKSPKIYLTDSGILHALLNITRMRDLENHPKLGASWEGFVINQVIRQLGARSEECYFWGTHAGSELDLIIVSGRWRLGFEVKRSSSPRLTPSMRNALKDLKLRSLDVIHAGEQTFGLAERIRAVAFSRLLKDIKPIRQ
ncbi:MAG: ATP-binding protein [Candidatus Aminicenantes bacterium]|nr:ATP-binding protein [Candidatus Aminicenantes bacterium]